MDDDEPLADVEIFAAPQVDAIILDIRHPDEVYVRPLRLKTSQVEEIPFFALQNRFKDLDPDTRYMLYCDKGVMSRLHAELLVDQGFENVAVYRPAWLFL